MQIQERDLPVLAQKLKPYLILGSGSGGASAGGMAVHELNGPYHTGQLSQAQAPWATPLTTFNTHVSSAGDPHTQYVLETTTLTAGNGLTGGGDLSANRTFAVGVSGLGLGVGADAVTLTSSSNPGAAASILASDANGDLTLVDLIATTQVSTPKIITGSGALTLDAAGDLITIGASNNIRRTGYASQTTGWAIDYNGAADFRSLYSDEMHVKLFIADLEQALAGAQIIAKSVAFTSRDFTVPAAGDAATLYMKDLPSAANMAVFESGDIVRLRFYSRASGTLTITSAWGVVTSYSDLADGEQSWTFTRSSAPNAGGAGAGVTYAADSIVLDYGVSGNGFHEVNAVDGAYGVNSPYSQIVTWATHPSTGQTVRSRTGNLNGISGLSGKYGTYYRGGIWIYDSNGNEKIVLDDSGNASIAGSLTLGTSGGIYQGSGTFASPTTGLKMWNDGGTGRIAGYNGGTLQAGFNTSGKLTAGAGAVTLDASGVILSTHSTNSYLRFEYSGAMKSRMLVSHDPAFDETQATWGVYSTGGAVRSSVSLYGVQSGVGQFDGTLTLSAAGSGGGTSTIALTSDKVTISGAVGITQFSDSADNIAKFKPGSFALADNAEVSLPDTTAFLIVHNSTDGNSALFFIRGGANASVEVSDSTGTFSITKDTASSINIYYDSGTGGYTIQNKRGGSKNIHMFMFGLSTSF